MGESRACLPTTTHRKILIVEDEDILQLVKLYLEKDGFRTVSAMTGTEGLVRQVKAEHPRLGHSRSHAPELDGLEVCKTNPPESGETHSCPSSC